MAYHDQFDFKHPSAATRLSAGNRALYESTLAKLESRQRQPKPVATAALDGKPFAPMGTSERFQQERDLKKAVAHVQTIDRASLRQHGFRDFADYLTAVRKSSHEQRKDLIDPRLIANAAPGAGSERTGSDGGFAVPPDFAAEILSKVFTPLSLLMQTDARTVRGNALTIPKDETTPWQTTGGISATWEDELGQAVQSKPALTSATLKTAKLLAFVPVTDELADDAVALVEHISSKAPEKINFAIEQAIIAGSGVGRPKGILASAGTIVVAEESGQTAGTIVAANVSKMWNRTLPSARRNGTWLVHPDADLQLQVLVLPGTAGNVAAAAPMYQPPSAFAPNGSLLGRPIYFSAACPPVGTVGDIIFGDLSAYITATKVMRNDVSIHLWFDYDIVAYRFTLRIGGQPWTDTPVAGLQSGTATRGFFTALATRS